MADNSFPDQQRFSRKPRLPWPRTLDELTTPVVEVPGQGLFLSESSGVPVPLETEDAEAIAKVSREAAALMAERAKLIHQAQLKGFVLLSEREKQRTAAFAAQQAQPQFMPPVPPTPAPVPGFSPAGSAGFSTVESYVPQPQPREGSTGVRSGVQLFLYLAGVTLISITAIFFLVLAYYIANDEIRAVLILAIGVALLLGAWLLKRKNLSGGAEALTALAGIFLLLGVWFIHASDSFGAAALDIQLYAGLGGLLTAIVLLIHRRSTAIALGGFASALLFPAALGSIISGSAHSFGVTELPWFWLFTAAVGASLYAVWPSKAEQTLVRVLGLAALGGASLAALLVFEDNPVMAVLAPVLNVMLWVLGYRVSKKQATPAWGMIFAAGAGATLASVLLGFSVQHLPQYDLPSHPEVWLPYIAAGMTVVLLLWLRRQTADSPFERKSSHSASVAAGTVLGLLSLPLLVVHLMRLQQVFVSVIPWNDSPDQIVSWGGSVFNPGIELSAAQLLAMSIALAALALTVVVGMVLVRSTAAHPVTVFVVTGLLLLVSFNLPQLWMMILAQLGIALTLFMVSLSHSTLNSAARSSLLGVLMVLALVSLGSSLFWLPVTGLVAIVLLWLAVHAQAPLKGTESETQGGSIISLLSTVLFAILVPATGLLLSDWFSKRGIVASQGTIFDRCFWLALFAVAGFLLLRAVKKIADQRVESTASAPHSPPQYLGLGVGEYILLPVLTLAGVLASFAESSQLPSDAARIALFGVLLLVALWLAFRRSENVFVKSFALLSAPVWWVLLVLGSMQALLPELAADQEQLIVVLAALLAAVAGFLCQSATVWSASQRALWDVPVVVFASLAGLAALMGDQTMTAVTALIAALVWLVTASSPDGIIRSSSTRKYLGWVSLLIVGLALWQVLRIGGSTQLEWYTLSTAGLLLLALLAIIWRGLPQHDYAFPRTLLLSAVLALSLLPTALLAALPDISRAWLVVGAGLFLSLLAVPAPRLFRGVHLKTVLSIAGLGSGYLGAVLALSSVILRDKFPTPSEGFWIALGMENNLWFLLLPPLLSAVILIASERLLRVQKTAFGSLCLIVMSLVPVFFAVIAGAAHSALFLLLLFSAGVAAVSSLMFFSLEHYSTERNLSFASLTAVALLAWFKDIVAPFELVTLPAAMVLIAGGIWLLVKQPQRGSWSALTPGLLLLLVPSLLQDFLPNNELWRVVLIGVLATAALVLGVLFRLKAPLVLGGTVLLVHSITQLWPWIVRLYENTEWWLWPGLGGLLLIVLAVRYEKNLRDLRNLGKNLAALR